MKWRVRRERLYTKTGAYSQVYQLQANPFFGILPIWVTIEEYRNLKKAKEMYKTLSGMRTEKKVLTEDELQ